MQQDTTSDMTNRHFLLSIMFALACLGATCYGLYRLIVPGPFGWHAKQPELIQGGLELLLLAIVTMVALIKMRSAHALLVTLAISAVYLRLHNADFSVFLASIYVFGIYGLGWAFTALLPITSADAYAFRKHALRFASGISLIAGLLMLAGLVFRIGFEATRVAGISLALLGCTFSLAKIRHAKMPAFDWTRHPTNAAALALVLATLLACMARSNTVFYYDSIWYGMRPDRVLFGEEGLFQFIGLTTQVHYYPKLYEVILAPLQLWGDASVAIAFAAFCAVFLAIAVGSLCNLFRLPTPLALVVVALLICTPAVAGSIETTKGDVLSAACILFAITALCRLLDTRDPDLLVDVAVFSMLASTLRLSALPWLALIFLVWTAALAWSAFRNKTTNSFGKTCLLLLPALIAFCLTHLRTWILTGTPIITNGSLQAKFDQLGMQIRFPVASLTGNAEREGWVGAARILPDLALRPDLFEFHRFKWMGAAWLLFLAIAISRPDRWARSPRGLLVMAIAMVFPMLIAFNSWQAKGGDGNYFMVSIAAIYLCGMVVLRKLPATACWLLLLCATGGFYAHLLGSNWTTGTSRLSIDLTKSPMDEAAQTAAFIENGKISQLAYSLEGCDKHTRAIGRLPLPAAFALPIRYEAIEELSWGNTKSFESPDALMRLVAATGTDLVILANRDGSLHDKTKANLESFLSSTFDNRLTKANTGQPLLLGDATIYPVTEAGEACVALLHDGKPRPAQEAQVSSGAIVIDALPTCGTSTTTIRWSKPEGYSGPLHVWIGEGKGRVLFAKSPSSGSQATGKWAREGLVVVGEMNGQVIGKATMHEPSDCK